MATITPGPLAETNLITTVPRTKKALVYLIGRTTGVGTPASLMSFCRILGLVLLGINLQTILASFHQLFLSRLEEYSAREWL